MERCRCAPFDLARAAGAEGILSPSEAPEAVERGIDGVIVSNHGGRQLDGAIAALPRIVDTVDGRIPVLLDGGLRRGAVVVKSIALGATACLIARPQVFASNGKERGEAPWQCIAMLLQTFRPDECSNSETQGMVLSKK